MRVLDKTTLSFGLCVLILIGALAAKDRDGGSWERLPTGIYDDFLSIWGPSDSDLYALTSKGAVLNYQGGSWIQVYRAPDPIMLMDIARILGKDIFALRSRGTIVHYDGTQWALEASPEEVVLKGYGFSL